MESSQDHVEEFEKDAKILYAVVGRSIEIHIWEDRTRGEQWVPSYDPSALVLEEDDFLRTASGNAVDSGKRTFVFQAVTEGLHRILFEKRMGWKFTAEDRRVFMVNATRAPQGTL